MLMAFALAACGGGGGGSASTGDNSPVATKPALVWSDDPAKAPKWGDVSWQ